MYKRTKNSYGERGPLDARLYVACCMLPSQDCPFHLASNMESSQNEKYHRGNKILVKNKESPAN